MFLLQASASEGFQFGSKAGGGQQGARVSSLETLAPLESAHVPEVIAHKARDACSETGRVRAIVFFLSEIPGVYNTSGAPERPPPPTPGPCPWLGVEESAGGRGRGSQQKIPGTLQKITAELL